MIIFDVQDVPVFVRKMIDEGKPINEAVNHYFRRGTLLGRLYTDDIFYIHSFDLEELAEFQENFTVEDVKVIYLMEFLTRARVWTFLNRIIKKPEILCKMEKVCEMGFNLAGVIFGSGGRFESTLSSDWDAPLFIYSHTEETRWFASYFREKIKDELFDVRKIVERQIKKFPEFTNTTLCSLVTDFIFPIRSWEFAIKTKRTFTHTYFLGYCFLEHPENMFKRWRKFYFKEVGVERILKEQFLNKISKRHLKELISLLKGDKLEIDPKELKRMGINLFQGLFLQLLGEQAGHSLIQDLFLCWREKKLTRDETSDILSSILEVYRARKLQDLNSAYTPTNPQRLKGFWIALKKFKMI
jgi:hypothetical protein